METSANEKALRLKSQLEEALKPLHDKINSLEQEVKELRKEQSELKQLLEKK
ncbi:hypothetical protein [Virgibacillus siamensis]|uniref:hypothetical protein n=1 Tax=Virgibacillus siamensis TaxID=480071 RepID=UPI00158F5BBF|nr:hypothetical protein [Virgibacillus siamensis]